MKISQFTLSALMAGALFLTACQNTPESDKAVTTDAQAVTTPAGGEVFTVDPSNSTIEWIGSKVTALHSGTIAIKDGQVTVANGALTGGKFTLDVSSITVTGPEGTDPGKNSYLQDHLHSEDFFNVAAFPEGVFEITKVTPFTGTVAETNNPTEAGLNKYRVANPTHTVSGNLTLKNITKNIEFPARITVTDSGVDALAKFNIDRTQWDITYPGKPDDLIRNEVHLGINLKAVN